MEEVSDAFNRITEYIFLVAGIIMTPVAVIHTVHSFKKGVEQGWDTPVFKTIKSGPYGTGPKKTLQSNDRLQTLAGGVGIPATLAMTGMSFYKIKSRNRK